VRQARLDHDVAFVARGLLFLQQVVEKCQLARLLLASVRANPFEGDGTLAQP